MSNNFALRDAISTDTSLYNSSMVPISAQLINFFEPEQCHLWQDSQELLRFFATHHEHLAVHDFSFMVFPLAKLYEGFLKTYFYRQHLISERVYRGRKFRVGRSFNPDLPSHLRDEHWLYDDVERLCGADTARRMWQVWLEARNHLFHYFPHDEHILSFAQARALMLEVVAVMDQALPFQAENPQVDPGQPWPKSRLEG